MTLNTDTDDLQHCRDALAAARETLLSLRGEQGHWEGELSSSALSTATAVCALRRYLIDAATADERRAAEVRRLVDAGLRWLVDNQNADGGWGDTTLSFSNISTTALCWAAVTNEPACGSAEQAAIAWLTQAAGSIEPSELAAAVRRRYGKDHTFSVPILTTLALHGRLGEDPLGRSRESWRLVPQLPFEMSVCPPSWYARLRLRVVSYALPALIAIGLVRHTNRPTRNPLMLAIRSAARRRALSVLRSIQPADGGFLEATPLTSFVTLGLLGAGEATHPVVGEAIAFLIRSARPDGSWPIDTNLATWVTTLATNALSFKAVASGDQPLPEDDAAPIRDWLLAQQHRLVHPYTQADPGGWAWTDLPGGVPDADDTPGALLALDTLGVADVGPAAAGVRWLLSLQNSDGGLPTFCRGWGALPFDRSSCDITAHALRAWRVWRDRLPAELRQPLRRAQHRALAYLARQQQDDGSWPPLWFGNQHATAVDETNLTYGTSRVLLALADLLAADEPLGAASAARAADWLVAAQNADSGWGGVGGVPSSIEETALAVEALAAYAASTNPTDAHLAAVRSGAQWLIERTSGGTEFPPTPIGFYFAKLWYHERMYPVVYTVAALGRATLLLATVDQPSAVSTGATA
ncbi:Sporulenol synthase [Posidoniimonas polymericola]|uniref:Sporulenol synthase n=1 Tax=Posidoniimonas polymericola TaxID=2528002 RepID=A0A5C5YLN8_9BACT|nr:prenyltransferase/squalene oxidase repeat-containing protein [Posidoniimonas polymericola]TWT75668.1 Sporulenol synthase [Posidoniimonas polymericola]